MAETELEDFLVKRARDGLLRTLIHADWRREGKICFNGRTYADFSSNDYLGLSGCPELSQACKEAIDGFGTGACASRLLSGSLQLHRRLEEETARFKNKEAALFFNSGYQANVGIISAFYGKADAVFSDRLSHASIIDGALLSGARLFRFQHNDPGHLEQILVKQRAKFKNSLVVTESIFSMDGDRARLKELTALKEKYNCQLFVDEAHATGIYGQNGSGVVEEEGLSAKVDFIMGTFSKALGSFGAYLACSRKAADYLINTCRSFIYSTALPGAIAAANLAALKLVEAQAWRRQQLLKQTDYLRQRLESAGFNIKGSSCIIPVIIGGSVQAQKIALSLQEQGYWVLPVRPPTVPPNQARLRISVCFHHNRQILEGLYGALVKIRI